MLSSTIQKLQSRVPLVKEEGVAEEGDSLVCFLLKEDIKEKETKEEDIKEKETIEEDIEEEKTKEEDIKEEEAKEDNIKKEENKENEGGIKKKKTKAEKIKEKEMNGKEIKGKEEKHNRRFRNKIGKGGYVNTLDAVKEEQTPNFVQMEQTLEVVQKKQAMGVVQEDLVQMEQVKEKDTPDKVQVQEEIALDLDVVKEEQTFDVIEDERTLDVVHRYQGESFFLLAWYKILSSFWMSRDEGETGDHTSLSWTSRIESGEEVSFWSFSVNVVSFLFTAGEGGGSCPEGGAGLWRCTGCSRIWWKGRNRGGSLKHRTSAGEAARSSHLQPTYPAMAAL